MLPLLFALSPWEAPNPWAVPAPPPPAPPPPAAFAADEQRVVYDAQGRKLRELVFVAGALAHERTYTYDAAGRPQALIDQEPNRRTEERWRYDDRGALSLHVVAVDGVVTLSEQSTWTDGRLTALRTQTPDGGVTTTYAYDAAGLLVSEERRDPDGRLLSRTVMDRAPAPPAPVDIPIVATASLGRTQQSLTGQQDSAVAFSIVRKPTPAQYAADPLEVRLSSAYARSEVGEEVVNDDLKGAFGIDYNELVPRVTPFVFGAVERNPATNLGIDLTLAPAGLKYDLVKNGHPVTFDVSAAPVWGYRAVDAAAGSDCDGFTLEADGQCVLQSWRASLRLRLGYARTLQTGALKLLDVVEALPRVDSSDPAPIYKNTATLSIPLFKSLAFTYSLAWVQDPLLPTQVDCVAAPDNLACDSQQLQSSGMFSFSHSFHR